MTREQIIFDSIQNINYEAICLAQHERLKKIQHMCEDVLDEIEEIVDCELHCDKMYNAILKILKET